MSEQNESDLRKRIIQEMTVNYTSVLERHFVLAKQFIRITKDGTVDILCKDRLIGKEQILLYLIGKLYAKEAGLSTTADAGNQELMGELGIPEGSVLPWLKELRDQKKIVQTRRGRHTYHSIPVNLVERTLRSIEAKLFEGGEGVIGNDVR